MSNQLPVYEEVYRRTVSVCEMLYGQPEAYYQRICNEGRLAKIDFSAYHLMITGLACQVYRPYFGIDAFDYTREYLKLEKEIHDILGKQGVVCITTMLLYDYSKRMCIIFNAPENLSPNDVAEMITSCFNHLYARIFDMSRTPYRNYTVLSDEIHGYANLKSAFREINALSRQQYFDMRSIVMTPALLESVRIPADHEQIHEELIRLYVAMRAGETEEMCAKFRAVMAQLERARDFHLLEDTLASMRRTLEGILFSHGKEMEDSGRAVFDIASHATFQIQRDEIEAYLIACVNSLKDTRPMSHLIQEAVRYIRHHYAEDIAVSDVAEHIGMSQSWLTKRFKQECGVNILNYLLSVRIERAKALLAQTDMLILEIACATGFENPGYFISVFRRAADMTPKAYREKMQEKA